MRTVGGRWLLWRGLTEKSWELGMQANFLIWMGRNREGGLQLMEGGNWLLWMVLKVARRGEGRKHAAVNVGWREEEGARRWRSCQLS